MTVHTTVTKCINDLFVACRNIIFEQALENQKKIQKS